MNSQSTSAMDTEEKFPALTDERKRKEIDEAEAEEAGKAAKRLATSADVPAATEANKDSSEDIGEQAPSNLTTLLASWRHATATTKEVLSQEGVTNLEKLGAFLRLQDTTLTQALGVSLLAIGELRVCYGTHRNATIFSHLTIAAEKYTKPSAAPALVITEKVANSWRAFLQQLDKRFVKLDDGQFFLGIRQLGGRLMARDCYVKLKARVCAAQIYIILGNPGIGKSLFLVYLIQQLVKDPAHPPIVYEHFKGRYPILIKNQQFSWVSDVGAIAALLEDSETWYLVDGLPPRDASARTVLVTSPKKSVYYELAKQLQFNTNWMPLWDVAELELARTQLYPEVPEKDFKEALEKWGPVPRVTLLKPAVSIAPNNALDNALRTASLDMCIKFAGEKEASDEVPHRLMHVHVDSDTFLTTCVRFASDYVLQRVTTLWVSEKEAELVKFLLTSHSKPWLSSLRGQLFEEYSHKVLPHGGQFRVRALAGQPPVPSSSPFSDSEGVVRIAPTPEPLVFSDVKSLSPLQGSRYARPKASNFAAIDSLQCVVDPQQKLLFMFQMTVTKEHPISARGLKQVLKRFPDYTYYLFFVVPPELYDVYEAQPFHDASGHVLREGSSSLKICKTVRQLVLQIALTGPALVAVTPVAAIVQQQNQL